MFTAVPGQPEGDVPQLAVAAAVEPDEDVVQHGHLAEQADRLERAGQTAPGSHLAEIHLTLNHEEIAEILDTTRETVSRLFGKFERERLLQLKGKALVIRNRRALEKIAPKWESCG